MINTALFAKRLSLDPNFSGSFYTLARQRCRANHGDLMTGCSLPPAGGILGPFGISLLGKQAACVMNHIISGNSSTSSHQYRTEITPQPTPHKTALVSKRIHCCLPLSWRLRTRCIAYTIIPVAINASYAIFMGLRGAKKIWNVSNISHSINAPPDRAL